MSAGAVVPKRVTQPAFRDGVILGKLACAENALIWMVGGHAGSHSEDEHIRAAFRHVLQAQKIVRKRVETRA